MSESKHTPGPWSAGIGSAAVGDSIDIHNEGALIATVLGADEFPCLDDGERDGCDICTRANAHLIAAAPELLEALKWALENLGCEPYELAKENAEAYQKALAVIAKAEGR